jgi:uncharacterized protein involved in outer membrane biogenesis
MECAAINQVVPRQSAPYNFAMKRIFKWLIGLFLAAVALVVIAVIVLALSYNSILRAVIERQIRAQTGMDVEIGSMKIALISPTVEIQNIKIHNSRDFGGTPFLDIPEIHVEYDRAALARRELHLTLVRFNLGELDIVKNQAGQTNIFLPGIKLSAQKSGGGNSLADFKKQSGYDFTGIDMLNVSIGKVKYVDLNNQQNNREQTIGIDSLVIPNVKSQTDLLGLAADIALRSNGFFETLLGQKKPGLDLLKQLGL